MGFTYLSFFNYSFGIEPIKMFIHPRSSLERPTRFQTEMGSVYPFSDQNGGKTLPDGAAHSFMAYIREYPPPGQKHRKFSGSACSRIPLEPCVFGACSGNRSVFILDPPLKWQFMIWFSQEPLWLLV